MRERASGAPGTRTPTEITVYAGQLGLVERPTDGSFEQGSHGILGIPPDE